MEKTDKILAEVESIQQLTESILKLSTALLVVPPIFLRFIAEMGPKANPDALRASYEVGLGMKCGIFVSLGLSIFTGILTKFLIIGYIRQNLEIVEATSESKKCRAIDICVILTCVLFIVGMGFLVYLFLSFPIEIPEPFRIGRSKLS